MAALEINDSNYDAEVGSATLLDFHAVWCGPCKAIAPIIEELAGEYDGKNVTIAKVDIDQAPQTATKFSITGVPTLVFLKDGQEVDRIVGAAQKNVIEQKLQSLV